MCKEFHVVKDCLRGRQVADNRLVASKSRWLSNLNLTLHFRASCRLLGSEHSFFFYAALHPDHLVIFEFVVAAKQSILISGCASSPSRPSVTGQTNNLNLFLGTVAPSEEGMCAICRQLFNKTVPASSARMGHTGIIMAFAIVILAILTRPVSLNLDIRCVRD